MKLKKITAIFLSVLLVLSMLGAMSFAADEYIEPHPGEKTLSNLFVTALEPCGECIYVWGGGHEVSDTVSIGPGVRWRDYFLANAGSYDYNKHRFENRNGLDCSGYIGWLVYNVFEKTNGKASYVLQSTSIAKNYAGRGWGQYITNANIKEYKPGDIVSMNGHVWLTVGQCDDGSIVLIHSSTQGGVQISGTIDKNGSHASQAVTIADKYMKEYFPYFYSAYGVKICESNYFTGNLMRWDLTSGPLKDPDGLAAMDPDSILNYILSKREPCEKYADISGHPWYAAAVDYVMEKELMNGMGPGIFDPDGSVTRAQFAQVLFNSSGEKGKTYTDGGFEDVKSTDWYYEAVSWANENNVMMGYGEGIFGARDRMTREQMATALYRYYSADHVVVPVDGVLNSFVDKDQIHDYALEPLSWAVNAKVINGTDEKKLLPRDNCSRAQLAQVLMNFYK